MSADPGTEEVSRHLLGTGTGQIWLCIRMGNLDPVIGKNVMEICTFPLLLMFNKYVMLLTFLCELFCPGSAFPILIWIRIQDSQINADPDLDLNPQHLLLGIILKSMVL